MGMYTAIQDKAPQFINTFQELSLFYRNQVQCTVELQFDPGHCSEHG